MMGGTHIHTEFMLWTQLVLESHSHFLPVKDIHENSVPLQSFLQCSMFPSSLKEIAFLKIM